MYQLLQHINKTDSNFFFRFKIIDDGDLITFNEKIKKKPEINNEPSDDDEREALALMTTQEELPQVAGIVDDSTLKTKFTTGGWKNAFERNDSGTDINIKEEPLSDNEDGNNLQRKRHDSDRDTPPRRKRNDSDPDSPPRRKRHDSDPDSPPRRRRQRQDSSEDNSPPRR